MSEEWQALIGVELAGLRLTELLGVGGQAAVFVGVNDVDATEIRAVKVVAPHLARNECFKQRFLDEARLLKSLNDERIVKFHGVRVAPAMQGLTTLYNGERFMALELELLRGSSLQQLFDTNAALDPLAVLEWMAQAAEGLSAAHREGIVHRDVKPGNLFLCDSGRIKVIDFGIARAVSLADAESGGRLTKTGHTAGTALFIAPELWADHAPTPASDLYALGLTLGQMLLGRHPFYPIGGPPPTAPAIMMGHLRHELAPYLCTEEGPLPASLIAIIVRLCARDPANRPADALAAAVELRAAAVYLKRHLTAEAALRATDEPITRVGQLPRSSEMEPEFTNPVGPAETPLEGTETKWRDFERASFGKGASSERRLMAFAAGCLLFAGVVGLVVVTNRPVGFHQPAQQVVVFAGVKSAVVGGTSGPSPDQAPMPIEEDPNPFVAVAPPPEPIVLGMPEGRQGKGIVYSSNAEHQLLSPTEAYRIQQHEVTWGEVRAWAAAAAAGVTIPSDAHNDIPATGLTWEHAQAYCASLDCPNGGCALPTEAQWEFAARGAEGRTVPWGGGIVSDAHVYQGAGAPLTAVTAPTRDETPTNPPIRYLLGNAREWTRDVYRDDDLAHTRRYDNAQTVGDFTFYVIRGLPLHQEWPEDVQDFPNAYRDKACSGVCPNAHLSETGFRCVAPPLTEAQGSVEPSTQTSEEVSTTGEQAAAAVEAEAGCRVASVSSPARAPWWAMLAVGMAVVLRRGRPPSRSTSLASEHR